QKWLNRIQGVWTAKLEENQPNSLFFVQRDSSATSLCHLLCLVESCRRSLKRAISSFRLAARFAIVNENTKNMPHAIMYAAKTLLRFFNLPPILVQAGAVRSATLRARTAAESEAPSGTSGLAKKNKKSCASWDRARHL